MTVERKDEMNQLTVRDTGELAVSYDQARAQKEIEGAIVLSKRFPRDEMKIAAAIQRSCRREMFAEKARYAFPRGGSTISGPSVNLARELARLWGNVRYGFEVVRDDDDTRKIRAYAWDMESNATVLAETEFKKLVYRKAGGWVTPDERDLRELTNKHAAILIRNCILQIVPPDFVEDAMQECARTLKGNVSANRGEVLKKLVRAFDDLGVSTDMLERKYGYKVAEFTEDDIAELRAIYQSIEDGNSTRDEHFSATRRVETGAVDGSTFEGMQEVKEAAEAPPAQPAKPAPKAERVPPAEKPSPASDLPTWYGELIRLYRKVKITGDDLERALHVSGYPLDKDPAKITGDCKSDPKLAIGKILEWGKE